MADQTPEIEDIDWMAEAALYCQPHGEKHDSLACLRQLALAAASGGRWSADLDSCDCDMGCSHGSWVHAVHVEKTHSNGALRKECDPDNSLDVYSHDRTDMGDFTWDEAHYIVAAQPSVVLDLLHRIERIEALADGWERDVAVLRGDAACGDIEADWLANNRQQHLDQLRAALLNSPEGQQPGGAA